MWSRCWWIRSYSTAASRVTCSPGGTPALALTIQFASSIEVYSDLWLNTSHAPRSPRKRWKKIRYEPFKGRVLFHTTYSDYFKENVHLFDPLDFLAELGDCLRQLYSTSHRRGCNSFVVMVCTPRASRVTGPACPTFSSGRHQVGRAKMTTRPPPHPTGPGAQRCLQRKPTLQTRVNVGMRGPACSLGSTKSTHLSAPALRSSVTGDRSDPESRPNHKDPEPSGENRSGATGTRSDHPGLNRYSALSRTAARIAPAVARRQGAPASARRTLHRASSSPYTRHSHRHAPASAVVIAASAKRSPLVLTSHDPTAARGALGSFGSRLLFLSIIVAHHAFASEGRHDVRESDPKSFSWTC